MERNADRIPKPGEIYRHFKNRLYQVIGVARHSETGEKMVVYQALYGDFGLYVRPLEMFISPVDREKYPQAAQKYRFERVQPAKTDTETQSVEEENFRESPNPDLIRFLEAEEMDEKLEALAKLEKTATQADLNGLAAALDTDLGTGGIREQIENVRRLLGIQARYDGSRLRER